jgi:ribosomal protein L16 Arg81 hydroxylase
MVARMRIVDLKREMDARFEQVDARFEQVDARFEGLERAFATEHETTRRHMDVLMEQVRADYRLTHEKMDAILAQLAASIASNTAEHAGFVAWLEDHEVRLESLERPTLPPTDPRSR